MTWDTCTSDSFSSGPGHRRRHRGDLIPVETAIGIASAVVLHDEAALRRLHDAVSVRLAEKTGATVMMIVATVMMTAVTVTTTDETAIAPRVPLMAIAK